LVTVVGLLIVLGAGGVGVSAYLSSRRVVDGLFRDLAHQIGNATTQRTLRYLEPAVPYARMTDSLMAAGRLRTGDEDALLDHFGAAVDANPSFTWASFAQIDGTYVAVQRTTDGTLLGTIRSQDAGGIEANAGPLDGEGPTRWREFTPSSASRGWRVSSEHRGTYDPRTRGWYTEAREGTEGRWVRPFLFFTRRQPGFMYVLPVGASTEGTEDDGVLAVEYEISALSSFLSTLRVGEHGRVYLLTRDGLVVGHPDGDVTEGEGDDLAIASAASHSDPMLRGAYAAMEADGGAERWLLEGGDFRFGESLAMVHPFPAEHGMDLSVLVVAPVDDFFGEVQRQLVVAICIALLAAFLAIVAGAIFSTRISSALRLIAEELERIGRFELSSRRVSDEVSIVREVNEMAAVTDRMKSGLRSFGKYVPRTLVQELIGSGEEAVLGGKSRELTILFSDIAGFTSVSEKLTPTELVEALGAYLDALSSCIQDEQGTVDKYIGDAIMAFWGAPRELPDHALRACRAALAMQAAAHRLETQWKAEGKPVFLTRIGVNTGDCVVGNIGSPSRMNYTVMGDAVNLASRIEGLGTEYDKWLLIGESTAALVKDELVVRPIDWVAVKGKSRAVLVHELVGERAGADEKVLEAIAAYTEALDHYRARRWSQATLAFEKALAGFGEDGACTLMIARCRAYEANPPQEGWDGESIRKTK